MKSSRTSTNKNNLNSKKNTRVQPMKKVSTSPSSTNKKKTASKVNSATNKRVVKKQVNTVPIKKKKVVKNNVQAPAQNKKQVVRRNPHSMENNVRLNNLDELEIVPFFDNDSQTEIIPNRIRKVKPEEIDDDEEYGKEKKIKPKTILYVVFIIAILLVGGYLLFTLDTFNLTQIKINGNEKYKTNIIMENLDFEIGKNIFEQLIFSSKKNIDLPYLSKVNYRYSFPSTIVVDVKERYPSYIAKDKKSDKYYKIDNEGYLLEQCDISQKQDELLVEGIVFEENPEFGKKINEVYIKKFEVYTNIKELIKKYDTFGNITKINFSNSLTTITLDDKLNVTFSNDSNLEYKVSFLNSIIQKNGTMVEGTIDMSIENPVYSKYN